VWAISFYGQRLNIVQPGHFKKEETRTEMLGKFGGDTASKIAIAEQSKSKGPLQPLIDIVPDNLFGDATKNWNMLQVIFFVLYFGIGLILISEEKSKPVKVFFDGANEVIQKLIDVIMLAAPIGVFALLASLVVEIPTIDLFIALLGYAACVVGGLIILYSPGISFVGQRVCKEKLRIFREGDISGSAPCIQHKLKCCNIVRDYGARGGAPGCG
jgi:Na+/H+-dicarboxylate symporter